jgi:hypothetical protein
MGVLQGLASTGGYLYAAWKGEPGDDRLFYSRWNGSGKWAPASTMASGTVGGNTSAGPSLGVLGTTLYAAWKGEWSDPRLFFAKFNGTTWENQIQILNAYSDVGPALCALSSTQLVAAWKSIDQSLYYAVYNGSHWTTPSQIPGVASSVGPSLALYNGKVYAIWKGEGTDQSLWYASFDGSKWSGQTAGSSQTQIPNVGSSVGPSLATVGNKLYAVWKGAGTDERLWYASYDGSKWSGQTAGSSQTQIPNAASSVGAAIAEFNGKLYAMCKGKDSDVTLYNASFDPNAGTWPSAWATDIPGNTGPDTYTVLVTPPGGNSNYVLADSKGAALNGTTVTIIVVDDIIPDSAESYSFQINCNSPVQPSGAQPFVWQQFGFAVVANQLYFWTNCYRRQDEPNHGLLYWDSRSLPNNTGVVPLTNNRLPSGWQLTTTLVTDKSSGNVTGFACSITEADGTVHNWPVQTLESLNTNVVSGNLAPILNFQAILVGAYGSTTDFSAGHGIFLCYETDSLTASVAQDESGEGGDVQYSPLPASYPNGEFFQFFGVPSA